MSNINSDDTYQLEQIILDSFSKMKYINANFIRIKIGQLISKQIMKNRIDRSYICNLMELLKNNKIAPLLSHFSYFWNDKIININKKDKKYYDIVYQYKLVDFKIVDRFQINKDMDLGISILNKVTVPSMDFASCQNYSLIERLIIIPYIINDYTTLNINIYPDYITIDIEISHPHPLIDKVYHKISSEVNSLLNKINNIFV